MSGHFGSGIGIGLWALVSAMAVNAQPYAYVANRGNNTLAIVSVPSGTISATVTVDAGPDGVAVTPSGSTAYVSSMTHNDVSVVSLSSKSVIATIPAGTTPGAVAVSPNGALVYVVDVNSSQVTAISTASNTVIATISVGAHPTAVAFSPDSTRAYVPSMWGNSVSIINTSSNTVINTFATGAGPGAVAATPDGQHVYVTCQTINAVNEYDTAGNLVASIPGFSYPLAIAITPNGAKAFVTNGNGASVSAVNLSSNTIVATTSVGKSPMSVAISTDGTQAYVANEGGYSMSVLDTSSYSLVRTVANVGVYPIAVAAIPPTSAPANTPPTADSVTPNSGSGTTQSFAFKYSSVNGYGSLSQVFALINSGLSSVAGCYAIYFPASNALYLDNDTGTAWIGPLAPGAAGTLQNSQCTINGPTTTATGSGNTLTLTLAVSFKLSFMGAKTLFGYAIDNGSLNSGWQTLGTWTPSMPLNTPPTADSVTPNSGSGATQSFALKYSSVNGNGYLSQVFALINSGLSNVGGCYAIYFPASNALYLDNDTGTAWIGPLTPGAAGTLQNSQCTINGPTTTATGSGNTLTLTLTASFKPSFMGAKTLFGYAIDHGSLNSGWQTLGTWTPSIPVNTPPTTDSVTPNSGSGAAQSFAFKYSSVNGYGYLNQVFALINSGLNSTGGCYAIYFPSSNALYLDNDAGTAWIGPLTPGAGTLQNSQCTINGATTTAAGSGNTLTLTLSVSFSASFTAQQTLFGCAYDNGGLYSEWQTLGTWTSH